MEKFEKLEIPEGIWCTAPNGDILCCWFTPKGYCTLYHEYIGIPRNRNPYCLSYHPHGAVIQIVNKEG